MFFKKKVFCVLCERYCTEDSIKKKHKEIGVCHNCYSKLLTTKDKSFDCGDGVKGVFSPYAYCGGIAEAIKEFKFHGMSLYGKLFGEMIYDELKDNPYILGFDVIIPVPLHKKRLDERGYNQSEVMAEQLSKLFKIPLICDGLFRIRETKKQSSLVGVERRENVRGAFYAFPNAVSGKRIIMVDDVCTMGETLRACASALSEVGAKEIIAITLCVSKEEDNSFKLY